MTDETLKKLRRAIDSVDVEILGLLAQRLELAKQVGNQKRELKREMYDPAREEELIQHLKREMKGTRLESRRKMVLEIWKKIIELNKSVQK